MPQTGQYSLIMRNEGKPEAMLQSSIQTNGQKNFSICFRFMLILPFWAKFHELFDTVRDSEGLLQSFSTT